MNSLLIRFASSPKCISCLAIGVGLAACEAPSPPSHAPAAIPGRLVINEIDCQGSPLEWVELLNVGGSPATIDGVTLADGLDVPLAGRTAIPRTAGSDSADGSLEPGAFLVVSGDLSISCANDGVVLFGSDGSVIDQAPLRTGDADLGSWGRMPDGSGAFAETSFTPHRANRSLQDERDSIFANVGDVPVVDLYVSGENEQALRDNPKVYAPALFSWSDDGGVSPPQRVDVRIKGSITLREWDQKPALKINFARHDETGSRAFRGFKKMTLNNLTYDPAYTREWLSYEVMRRQGQAAPRVSWVRVRINGEARGVYSIVESYDEVFLRDWFPSTVALYEGNSDINGGVSGFELDEGDDWQPLQDLMEATTTATVIGSDNVVRAIPSIDWRQFAKMTALEDLLLHTDGYKSGCHNFFLHTDDAGTWSMLPWSTDLALLPAVTGALNSCGVLSQLCDADPQCRAWFERERDAAARAVLDVDWAALTVPFAERLQAYPRGNEEPWSSGEFGGGGVVDLVGDTYKAIDTLLDRARAIRCASAANQGVGPPVDDPLCGGFLGADGGHPR